MKRTKKQIAAQLAKARAAKTRIAAARRKAAKQLEGELIRSERFDEEVLKSWKEADAQQAVPNDVQVGGDHYKKLGYIQIWDVYVPWKLNPFQAAVLKYVVRYRDKGGKLDLEKAKHYLDKLIEVEYDNV